MIVAVVGLGIMGGSIAKSIKRNTSHTVWGCDKNTEVLETALNQKAIDKAVKPEELTGADLTFVCLYPEGTVNFITENAEFFAPGSIVADICGIKKYIAEGVESLLHSKGVNYVGTHPMAGREFSGFEYSVADLFENHSFIVTTTKETNKGAIETLRTLTEQMKFGQFVITTADDHDKIIAYTSQLAHVVSNAYIKSPTMALECGFSAGSFKDLTRVAMLNEDMWTSIFVKNKENLIFEIDTIINSLNEYKDALANDDTITLKKLLKDGSDMKKKSLGY